MTKEIKFKSPNYLVHYVEDCVPKIKKFNSKVELANFIEKIKKKQTEDPSSTSLDFFTETNNLTILDNYYLKWLKKPGNKND